MTHAEGFTDYSYCSEFAAMNLREIVALAPVIPELHCVDLDAVLPVARALLAGGLRVLEINLRTPVALPAIDAIRKTLPGAIVGAGALSRAIDFAAADRVGAHFGVTPGLTPELAAAARGARLALMPSVMTPTEVIVARHAGFQLLRLFPAQQAGGIGMLRELAVQFPDVTFCAAGGINADTAAAFLALPNVACISAAWLAPPAVLAARDWTAIEACARDALRLSTTAQRK